MNEKVVPFACLMDVQAKKYGTRTALRYRDYTTGEWLSISWITLAERVKNAAKGMEKIGIQEEENIATFTQNMPQGIVTDFAAYANRAVVVPLYATSSVDQVTYILNDAHIRYIFVGEQYQYDVVRQAIEKGAALKQIIIYDNQVKLLPGDDTSIFFDQLVYDGALASNDTEIAERSARYSELDLVNILYTSGTTGEPKGVMLAHSSYMDAMISHTQRLVTVSDKDVSMCFLPLTHIFERLWSHFCLYRGIQIDVNLRPQDIQQTIHESHPTILCSVPRFWEKVYAAVQTKIHTSKGIQRVMMKAALKAGRRYNLNYRRLNRRAPFWLSLRYALLDKLVFTKLRAAIGISHGNIFPVAGAPLSDVINEFFHTCGINLLYGYGLTETAATVTCFDITEYEIGTVGSPMPGVQVKIGENNEVMVKGHNVMRGYYNKPEETSKVLDANGWFKTGDAGKLSASGKLILTDRIKDLFKTSNGKYIAPQAIETVVSTDRYIDQIAVIGDQRRFVSALVVPDFVALKEYAVQENIPFSTLEELVRMPKIVDFVMKRIEKKQTTFASFEKIKRITLLPFAFSMEKGELTNTLKIKRATVSQRYSIEIEEMYK